MGNQELRSPPLWHDSGRIRQLNDYFLSLGTDYAANIQRLAQAAGDLLAAACAFYKAAPIGTPLSAPSGIPLGTPSGAFVGPATAAPSAPQSPVSPAGAGEPVAPLVVRGAQQAQDAQLDPHVQQCGLRTYIEWPVLVNARHVGSLCLGWIDDQEPKQEDLDLLQLLARAVAQQAQMEQRDRELMTLNEIGRVVTSALNLDEMLTLLRTKVRDVIGAQACSIALIDPATQELVFRQADDPLAEELVGRRLQPGQGIAGQVATSGKSELIPDVYADPRFYNGIDAMTGMATRELICAPLMAQDKTIGVIELLNKRQGHFTGEDVRLLESVAAETAAALENARLHEVTQHELNERIRAERALRETTNRLQTVIDAAPDLIYLKDCELRYLLVNLAFADFWEQDPADIVGQTDLRFMPHDLAQANQRSDQQVIDTGQVIIQEQQEGDHVIETRKAAVIDDEGRAAGIAGIVRDITDRKRLEEQMIQQRKEESVLTLSAGIAHDFNNALVGIVGNVELLRMQVSVGPEVARTLDAMSHAAERMVTLTDQLLAYAGEVQYQPQVINLNLVLNETLPFMQSEFQPGITLQSRQAGDLWEIQVNPAQIRQLLANLITNACESMAQQGGTLTLQTENAHREAWVCARHVQHPAGDYVHLMVADTGQGIDRRLQRRLFDPFFSTKFLGRGLGLAVALGIVRDHDGCIEIESQPGQGTAVHVYLPRARP